MRALYIIVPILCILVIAYRYYSAFIAARLWVIDETRTTPAHTKYDGANYFPTTRWVLFGHHFAAIAGSGPLIGPVLAAQFGYAPGLIWLVGGVCLAGAVQDSFWLWASTRRGGRSLADIARSEVSPLAGITAAIAILLILIIAMAGLGIAVVNALADSAWATFTIFMTIPLALVMGFYMFRWRKGHVKEATIVGVTIMFLGVVFGKNVAESSMGHWFVLTHHQIVIAMAVYTVAAAVLPVWMLLTPRAYLSTFMKIGTVAFLILGVMIVNPTLQAPAFSQFVSGGGPIIPGPLFPFVFITIACGAISGFHSLVSTGTTSKMIDNERDIRPIGYGAMLVEGVVGVIAIITAASLNPADYYAINTSPAVFHNLGLSVVNLPELQSEVGEIVAGRPGGAVSLAVGMAHIFSGLPGMRGLMAYWYHFAILFEAVFILTTIDSGTRIGRFLLQEFIGRAWKPFGRTDWLPGTLISTVAIVLSWSYFIWTGSISTIWPMFGVANQLLAVVALAVATTVIINIGRTKYMWITFAPLCFISTTTLTAGFMNVTDNFWPMAVGADPALHVQGYVNSICTTIMLVCAVVILASTAMRCLKVLTGRRPVMTLAEAEAQA
ncbi:MAG: carbon starvation protein A [Ignavibacteria bacterium 13_1_40CM_2_61_4]|nr:MAG: carbon starvation protein A [Acidobacteria bacterium 13_1_40CM_4_65_8]OLD64631.1 MAG: carbon starvation protein A [Ignavibacteria bacterium 13_1_40CM_2_61_4]